MRGTIVLTEGRSGSNWLTSLTNQVGSLGLSREWFTPKRLGALTRSKTGPELIDHVLEMAKTPNDYFGIKMFPAHLHWFEQIYHIDLIHHLASNHDVQLVRLTRNDRFRQAISFARGLQTKQWSARAERKAEPVYDFALLCRCYFLVERAYQYWDSYIAVRDLSVHSFVYEEMMENSPKPFVDCIANHAGVAEVELPQSRYVVQRDEITEQWLKQFRKDIATNGVVGHSTPSRPPHRTIANIYRLLRGRQLKPYPYFY
ncbi:MAG: Stf0 family sulfotransferase [Paracoccaceae bacterium]